MDKNELVKNFKAALDSLSYYNAAESDNYNLEREARDNCRNRVKDLAKQLHQQNIDPLAILNSGSYLASKRDLGDYENN